MELARLARLRSLYFNGGLPVYLVLFVTSRCTASCKTCFSSHRGPSTGKELTVAELERISRGLRRLWQVTLSGGEPFLREDLDEICKVFARGNSAEIVTIPTNGLHPDVVEAASRRFLAGCPDTFFRITLSVDGIGADQDRIRGVEGSFERLLETYARLVSLKKRHGNFNIDTNTVFSSYNQDRFPEIADAVWRQFPDAANHSLSLARGTTREPEAKNVSIEKYEMALLSWLGRPRKPEARPLSALFRTLVDLGRRNTLRIVRENRCVAPCQAIRKLAVVDEVGDVLVCEIIWEAIGSLRESGYDLGTILRGEKARSRLERIRRDRCFCSWECANILNVIYDPRMLATFAKDLVRNQLSAESLSGNRTS